MSDDGWNWLLGTQREREQFRDLFRGGWKPWLLALAVVGAICALMCVAWLLFGRDGTVFFIG